MPSREPADYSEIAAAVNTTLALDDPRWKELQAAYGGASDIPGKLSRFLSQADEVYATLRDDPDDLLYGSLCHQACTVYTATYAAVPHIINRATKLQSSERSSLLVFAGYVEAARDSGGPPIPDYLARTYLDAVTLAATMAYSDLTRKWDKADMRYLLGAYAALRGYQRLGVYIMNAEEADE